MVHFETHEHKENVPRHVFDLPDLESGTSFFRKFSDFV
jgi:hypothetical protein